MMNDLSSASGRQPKCRLAHDTWELHRRPERLIGSGSRGSNLGARSSSSGCRPDLNAPNWPASTLHPSSTINFITRTSLFMLCLNLKQARPKHEILTAHRKIQIVMNSKKKKILKGNQKLGQGTKTAVNKSLIKIKNQMWTSSQKSLNWYGPMWYIKGLHRPLKFQFLIYCILRFNQQRRYNLHQNQPKNHSNYTNEPGTNFWYLLIKNALWTSRRWLNSSGTRTKFNSKTKPSETSPKILISPRNRWPISLPHRINQAFWSNRKISLVYKEWVLNAKISMSTRLVLKHSRRPNGYSISGMPFVLSLGPKIQVGCLNRCPFGGGFFLPQALNADSTKTKVVGFKIFCFFSFVSCLKPPPKTP